jgi:osmotically-inducible protein OsmY
MTRPPKEFDMKAALFLTAATLTLLAACDNKPADRAEPVKPDNTVNNARDDNDATAKTPMEQSNDPKDIEITAQIRRAVVDDATMSTNAKNIKIITVKGAVTLRGVVETQAEKETIETKAKGVSGVVSVDNQLEVNEP